MIYILACFFFLFFYPNYLDYEFYLTNSMNRWSSRLLSYNSEYNLNDPYSSCINVELSGLDFGAGEDTLDDSMWISTL